MLRTFKARGYVNERIIHILAENLKSININDK